MGEIFISTETLTNPAFILIYTLVFTFLIQIIMLNIIFVWMNIKVLWKRMIICSLIGAIIGVLPDLIISIMMNDLFEARLWVYRICMYVNPIYCLLYFYIAKITLKFPSTRSLIVMRWQMVISYISTSVFMLINDLWYRIFRIEEMPSEYIPSDYISFMIILVIWICAWRAMILYTKKYKKYLIIPPSYADKNIKKGAAKILAVSCIFYGASVFFRTYWILYICKPLTFTTGSIYMLFIMGIILYLMRTNAYLRNKLLEWEMQATGTYISSLLHTNQEFQAIQHDFYNVLQGYSGYLAIKDYDGLKKYHQKLFATTKKAGDFLSIIEVLRSRIAVYSLLEQMSEKAKKAGVSFSINYVCDVKDIVLDDIDLCRTLGIVIDNAIEEAFVSKDKQVSLSFERDGEDMIILAISNTTKGDVDISKIFQEGYTTKNNHTGIGLSQVLRILNAYEHCSVSSNYHDNQFTILLILHAEQRRDFA